jgi:hypothetical protein
MRNVTIATIVATVVLTIGTLAYFSPTYISFEMVLMMIMFYSIPIGCGLMIYQGLRIYSDTDKKSIPWITSFIAAAILAGYALFMSLLWSAN